MARIDLRDLQVGGEAQCLGEAGRAGATNVLLRDYLDGRGGLGQSLGTLRDRGDLQIHQLLDTELLQCFGGERGIRLLSEPRPRNADQTHHEDHRRRGRNGPHVSHRSGPPGLPRFGRVEHVAHLSRETLGRKWFLEIRHSLLEHAVSDDRVVGVA